MKKLLLSTLLLTMTTPFAANVTAIDTPATETNSSYALQVPTSFADDHQLAQIIALCNAREAKVGSTVYPMFPATHVRHAQGRSIAGILAPVNNSNLEAIYSQLAQLYVNMFSTHISRVVTADGKSIYAYDTRTIDCALDWLATIYPNNEQSTAGKALSVFNLLTDPWFGSKEFHVAVARNQLTLDSAGTFFTFLQTTRPNQVADKSLTVHDVETLVRLLNPAL